MSVDNFEIVAGLISPTFDGDTFWLTELLDRSKVSGNNSARRVAEFIHRDASDLMRYADTIRKLCEVTGCRAYTRLTPRSFAACGKAFTRHIVDQCLSANFEGMRHAYAHILGVTPIKERRTWLWDIDEPGPVQSELEARAEFVATIPSRKGCHVITRPFDPRGIVGATLHRDNPTNLYIPDGAR